MQLLHPIVERHDAILARHVVQAAVLVKYVLQADIGRIILNESELRRKGDGRWEVELKIASARLLAFAQHTTL